MKTIVISSSSEFEECIKTFEESHSRIRDIFQNETGNVEKINKTDIWTGAVQEEIYDKNIELQKNFKPIEESLQIYIDFLKKTLNDYKRLDATINSNADENQYNLDVNS